MLPGGVIKGKDESSLLNRGSEGNNGPLNIYWFSTLSLSYNRLSQDVVYDFPLDYLYVCLCVCVCVYPKEWLQREAIALSSAVPFDSCNRRSNYPLELINTLLYPRCVTVNIIKVSHFHAL